MARAETTLPEGMGEGSRRTSLLQFLRVSSTPDRLRLLAVVTTLILAGVGLTAWLLTDRLVDQTAEVAENTGEVLIASQQVRASMAEADSAAVSVHLAGADGDREQRRLYEQALERATSDSARIARLVGDDDVSHELLEDVGSLTAEYAGLVDAARLASVEGLAGADSLLREANTINRDELAPRLEQLTERAQARFLADIDAAWYLITPLGLVMALVILGVGQFVLMRKFRRYVNLPLVLASIAMIVLLVFSLRAYGVRQSAFDQARSDAYDSLVASADIQQTAYRYRAVENGAVLQANQPDELTALADELTDAGGGLLATSTALADSARETATAQEIVARWNRYSAESARVRDALARNDQEQAKIITRGAASATFNGFNATVEASLLDNREQFVEQLDIASDSTRLLRLAIGIGTLAAAVLTWWGFALRIGEYR